MIPNLIPSNLLQSNSIQSKSFKSKLTPTASIKVNSSQKDSSCLKERIGLKMSHFLCWVLKYIGCLWYTENDSSGAKEIVLKKKIEQFTLVSQKVLDHIVKAQVVNEGYQIGAILPPIARIENALYYSDRLKMQYASVRVGLRDTMRRVEEVVYNNTLVVPGVATMEPTLLVLSLKKQRRRLILDLEKSAFVEKLVPALCTACLQLEALVVPIPARAKQNLVQPKNIRSQAMPQMFATLQRTRYALETMRVAVEAAEHDVYLYSMEKEDHEKSRLQNHARYAVQCLGEKGSRMMKDLDACWTACGDFVNPRTPMRAVKVPNKKAISMDRSVFCDRKVGNSCTTLYCTEDKESIVEEEPRMDTVLTELSSVLSLRKQPKENIVHVQDTSNVQTESLHITSAVWKQRLSLELKAKFD